jgi:signal transduction histidine kinase
VTAAGLRLAVAALAGALGLLAIALEVRTPGALMLPVAVQVAIGWAFVGAGMVAWARRPENRTGLLMALTGLVWLGRDLEWWRAPIPAHLSDLSLNLFLALIAHQVVVFPHGRARSRFERALVASAYLLAVGGYVLGNLFHDPRLEGCADCPRNLLLVHADHTLDDVANAVPSALAIVLVLAIVVHLGRRWRTATVPGRRALEPVAWTGPAAVAVAAATIAHFAISGSTARLGPVLGWATLVYAAIPLAFLAGLLRMRLHRAALGDLILELSELPPPAQVRSALARALGDPSLEVAFWLPEQARYVDLDGRPLELPDGDNRAATVLEHADERLAALVYDPSLLEDRTLVEAAGAAARLALENARLHAELRAQLAEVRASRARIVEAGDAERRRLERDLHDGAQQRLLGIRLALRLARGQLGDAGRAVEELLVEADEELEGTLDELRALARGIHPAVLTEEGLAPALEALARRASVPVELEAVPVERLPAPLEAAAYFVASEALANVAKHAQASRVRIDVLRENGHLVIDISDDGVGGADAAGGSGLVGLRDRVEALNGSLRIESLPGHGTRLHAEIPCDA